MRQVGANPNEAERVEPSGTSTAYATKRNSNESMVRKAAEGLSTDRSMAQAGLLRCKKRVQIRGRGIQSPPPHGGAGSGSCDG